MQSSPRPCVIMKAMISGVTFSAAAMKSPSSSRSSSSTTMMTRPSRSACSASSILEYSSPIGTSLICDHERANHRVSSLTVATSLNRLSLFYTNRPVPAVCWRS